MSLLIQERPLIILPTTAAVIGLQNAIVLQQLHFLLNLESSGKVIAGRKWIYNTYSEWRKFFPFWSEKTIQNIFTEMEKMFLIDTCQPEGRVSRRKYYAINMGMMAKLDAEIMAKLAPEQANIAPSEQANIAPSLYRTETTQRLQTAKAAKAHDKYPSEQAFNKFLDDNELSMIICHKPDLYWDLEGREWTDKGRPIHRWKEYLKALEQSMRSSAEGC